MVSKRIFKLRLGYRKNKELKREYLTTELKVISVIGVEPIGVGTIKKEIAYHGDVINTAARIQGECNAYNETLLISQTLLDKLKLHKYKLESIGDIALKGKESEVKLVSINKNS